MKKGTTYRQLNYEDRVEINTLRRAGKSIRAIARSLGRSANTISQELRFKQVRGVYAPHKAQMKTFHKRRLAKRLCLKVALDGQLTKLVMEKLALKWSPERIAGYARRLGLVVSKKAIYRFVQSRFLHHLLIWKGKRPTRKYRIAWIRVRDRLKIAVTERPAALTTGHWEVDFITSWASPAVLFVAVDRHTRFTLVRLLQSKKHQPVLDLLEEIKARYGLRSITVDNDLVFNRWRDMQRHLVAPFFFTSPFRAYEKGLVENTNRWIRLFVPKGRVLTDVSPQTLDQVSRFLNDTPRQCLGYKTAREVLFGAQLQEEVS